MRNQLILIICSLLFVACQTSANNNLSDSGAQRWQGQLNKTQDAWLVQDCSGKQFETLLSDESHKLVEQLQSSPEQKLFIDFTGHKNSNGQVKLEQVLRLDHESKGCEDAEFDKLIFRVQGNEPFWTLLLNQQGLELIQPDSEPIKLTYIEEQLPDGFYYISASSEQQSLQLWLSPEPCTDSMSGNYNHLSALLDWNGHAFQGCAHFGKLRN